MELRIILALIATGYALIGALCLVWPERLQNYAIRKSNDAPSRYQSLRRLVRSTRYVAFLQIVGAISSSAAVAVTLVLIRTVRG